MKLAVSVDTDRGMNSQIAHHFGRCPFFALVDLDGEQVKGLEILANPYFESHQPGQVPEFIHQQGAEVMISGGMGRRALEFFSGFGIGVRTGAEGSLQDVIEDYLAGNLQQGSSCLQSEAHHQHGHGHGHSQA